MTPFIKKKDIKKDWYIINAQNVAVGRLAAFISKVLRGKNKATYNPHMDNVTIRALWGSFCTRKLDKLYYR